MHAQSPILTRPGSRERAPTKCNGLDGGSRRRRGEGSELPSHVNQT